MYSGDRHAKRAAAGARCHLYLSLAPPHGTPLIAHAVVIRLASTCMRSRVFTYVSRSCAHDRT
eukprot:7004312-Prymnesium_polylepis.1